MTSNYRIPQSALTVVYNRSGHIFAVEVADDQGISLTEHSAYLWLDKPSAMQKVWSNINREAIFLYVPDANLYT